MFPALPAKFDFPAAERDVLAFWERERVFERSLEQRRAQGAPRFVFYEGPPTANGLPHPGHCLTRAIKDIFPRYQTMRGKLVERKAGWDTHGLPVEVEVCKELGIHTKEEIEAYGVEKFNLKCIQSVFRYTREWEEMTRRLGFWVNLDDAYVTFHQSYVESVWWGLKQLFDRGLLYQGHKVVWWWCQGGTALSAGEVGEGYRAVDDPSVYVKFPILGMEGSAGILPAISGSAGILPAISGSAGILPAIQHRAEYRGNAPHENRDLVPAGARVSLLVWTTTPWTLISNHFAAVHPELEYALVEDAGDASREPEHSYIAKALVEGIAKKVKRDLKVVGTCKGSDLVGLRYTPPFDSFSNLEVTKLVPAASLEHFQNSRSGTMMGLGVKQNSNRSCTDPFGWRVVAADFVTLDSGSGIVHVAPAFGQDDSELLAVETSRHIGYGCVNPLCAVAPNGNFNDFAPQQYRGRWVKDCDKEIIRELKDRGLLLHQEVYRHDYPFCPRAESDPLIQYARKSWFVRTSRFKDEFLANNDKVNWLPEHIKEGRFGDFLRNNVDWALSRERYWGTPLPIWECTRCGEQEAVSSFAELVAKPGATDDGYWDRKVAEHQDQEFPGHLRIHKPYIDEWTYPHNCTSIFIKSTWSGGPALMRRVPEVIDCWWDAGSMPFAQWGYPHAPGSDETFASRFPADFISEAIDQTRGWFYGLLSISTLLFGPATSSDSAMTGTPEIAARPAPAGSLQITGALGTVERSPIKGSAGVPPAIPVERATIKGGAGVPPAIPAAGQSRRSAGPELEIHRRYRLPHWEAGGSTYLVTFNLAVGELSPDERTLVLNACRHFDPERLLLHAAVVMQDHVHLLLTPQERARDEWWPLAELIQSIKSFSAKEINRCRGKVGEVWQAEYFDRIIRSASDFDEKWRYIVDNPARRGLPDSYPWVWVESPGDPSRSVREDPNCGRDARTPLAGDHADGGRDARTPLAGDHADGGRDARTPLAGDHADGGRDARTPRHGITSDFPLPFRNCIVLGHMMGEDGLKMSKRKKNYKEPSYIFDSLGADAMRWYFFSAQAPWTTTRFVEASIRDAQRDFLVRLYNVFSFFNIYANIDGFEMGRDDRQDTAPAGTGWREVGRRAELDRWIVSELHRTIAFVRQKLDAFENFPAAQRLNDFVDGLSNWYLRRSRDRFWRALQQGPADQDKWDAYNTLHEVLLALSQLIAPFTPFFAEVMYQHLVGRWEHENARAADQYLSFPHSHVASFPPSVHLCDYPSADPARVDEALAGEMDLVRDIVSSGRNARTEAKLKVRQPLARVEIILARQDHERWLRLHTPLIAEELNVKTVDFATSADQYVQYQIKANFKALGPKFGKLAPQIAAALQKIDALQSRQQLVAAGKLVLEVGGQSIELTPDEVEIRLEAKAGWAASQSRAGVVVLSTELTSELRDEGAVRELIHYVQAIRKDLNLAYEQRIGLLIDGPPEFVRIVRQFADTLRGECLADRIDFGPTTANRLAIEIEGTAVTLAVEPVN